VTATGETAGARRELDRLVASIRPPGAARVIDVRRHLDALTKPKGSLGQLETLALRLARIYGDPPPVWRHRVVYVLAADHGVAARGVSAYPAEVTAQMCRNYASGGAAVSAISRVARAHVVAVDVGVNADLRGVELLVHRKVRRGTRDLSSQPAMSGSEVLRAIGVGQALVANQHPVPDVIGLGEMGIGNTTAASALTAALTGTDPGDVTGRGTGIDPEVLRHKTSLVRQGVSRIPQGASPLRMLREVGGLEIAGLVGVVLGAARIQRAVVVDGFIATAAALVAMRLCPAVRGYLFAAHRSAERGHRVLLSALGLRPILRLGMRLGEGTGAALAIPVLEAAASVLRHMATFESAGVSRRVAARH
jgi:nicotinate-nucleotide--dimethylbenzimidazole phosphoribosyltransferase